MKAFIKLAIFVFVWAITFFLFATHVNIKGAYDETHVAINQKDVSYNFEYKYGFPTPWYSRYYEIPDDVDDPYKNTTVDTCSLSDSSCSKVPTPPTDSLVATDKAYDILTGQAILALIPISFISLIYIGISKYAHSRH